MEFTPAPDPTPAPQTGEKASLPPEERGRADPAVSWVRPRAGSGVHWALRGEASPRCSAPHRRGLGPAHRKSRQVAGPGGLPPAAASVTRLFPGPQEAIIPEQSPKVTKSSLHPVNRQRLPELLTEAPASLRACVQPFWRRTEDSPVSSLSSLDATWSPKTYSAYRVNLFQNTSIKQKRNVSGFKKRSALWPRREAGATSSAEPEPSIWVLVIPSAPLRLNAAGAGPCC